MSGWTDFRDKLEGVAPTILGGLATAAGGPVAGAAVAALGRALLGDPKASPDVIKSALASASPDQLLALKKADNDFAVEMETLGFKREELIYKDVADARARDKEFITAGKENRRADILAYLALGGLLFFGIAALVIGVAWPQATEAISACTLMIGYLLKEVGAVYNFEFGSTQSSKTKDETIAKLSE